MRAGSILVSIAALLIAAPLIVGCGPAPYSLGPEEPTTVELPGPQATHTDRPDPPDRWIPDGLPRFNPFVEHGTWVGEYDCPQGRTSLTFRVVDVKGTKVRAIFDFHHQPTDAAGQFMMHGVFDEHTGQAVFKPGGWLVRPESYVTVGMIGKVSLDGSRFEGRIAEQGCGAFSLQPRP